MKAAVFERFTILRAPIGNMVIMTAPGGSQFYFTEHGKGFARPAETPPTASPTPAPANRLPNVPPPIPGE